MVYHSSCFYLLVTAILCNIARSEAITCYSCTNVTLVSDCHSSVDCGSGESCFLDSLYTSKGFRYTLGCRDNKQCPTVLPSVVGRAAVAQVTGDCQECCSVSRCNKKLCVQDDQCKDGHDLDCEVTNTVYDICSDVEHSKLVCRRYCGLCSLVDGKWSPWSSWSSCDVTCDNGTQTRTRTCTEPAPAAGGSPCSGSEQEKIPCSRDACPIHGSWSDWAGWGSCSVTCGIGMQSRDRSCSNPPPSRYGDHCFGGSQIYRICLPGSCADGGWSSWNRWDTCSVSCGGGIQTRARSCNNPTPSQFGRDCQGDAHETTACRTSQCPSDQELIPAFTVTEPGPLQPHNVLTFNKTIINIGGDFNLSTGLFTCYRAGVYFFTLSLVKSRSVSSPTDYVQCVISKNDADVLLVRVDPTDDDTDKGSAQAANSAMLHLKKGDVVKLDSCNEPSDMEAWSSFSGFLVNPDV